MGTRNGRASIARTANDGLAFAVRAREKERKQGRATDRNQRMAQPGTRAAGRRAAREEREKCIAACEFSTSDVLAECPTGRSERQS